MVTSYVNISEQTTSSPPATQVGSNRNQPIFVFLPSSCEGLTLQIYITNFLLCNIWYRILLLLIGQVSSKVNNNIVKLVHVQPCSHTFSRRTNLTVILCKFSLTVKTIQASFIVPKTIFKISWYMFNHFGTDFELHS